MANIEVHHGTGKSALRDIFRWSNVYGLYYVHGAGSSSVLTNSLASATVWASGAEIAGNGSGVVLTFSIPERILKTTDAKRDPIKYYYTKDWVNDPGELPKSYLAMINMSVEEAIRRVATKQNRFYRVPMSFFTRYAFAKDILPTL